MAARKKIVSMALDLPLDAAKVISGYADENWMTPKEALYEMIRAGIKELTGTEIERED